MLVLKLCREYCPDLIPVTIADKLGDGADGEVFTFTEDQNKVIKLSALYECPTVDVRRTYEFTSKLLNYLIECPSSTYARVYEHKYMAQWSRNTFAGHQQKYIMYYYIMEKLTKISEDEKKVFHSLLSHEDRGIKKNFSSDKISEMLLGLARGLDFDRDKVTFFVSKFRETPIDHLDVHVRNIMKDPLGNFKLIDFDRAELRLENNYVNT